MNKMDLDYMRRRCDIEITQSKLSPTPPDPLFFEQISIQFHRQKDFKQEILYCERYLGSVQAFYDRQLIEPEVDVRNSAGYKAIVRRLKQAKDLFHACAV